MAHTPPSFHSFPIAKHVPLPANGKSDCSAVRQCSFCKFHWYISALRSVSHSNTHKVCPPQHTTLQRLLNLLKLVHFLQRPLPVALQQPQLSSRPEWSLNKCFCVGVQDTQGLFSLLISAAGGGPAYVYHNHQDNWNATRYMKETLDPELPATLSDS